jgi:GTP cyclohydrolase III
MWGQNPYRRSLVAVQDIYIAIDGDDIGYRLEYYMLTDQPKHLQAFSESFEASFSWLRNVLVNDFGATIVFSGCDNLLAVVKSDNHLIEKLEGLRRDFFERAEQSLSVGLGRSTREAYLALKLAKASGKDCIQQI